jgi:protein ImuB
MPVAGIQAGGGFTQEQLQNTAQRMNVAEDASFNRDLAINRTAMDDLIGKLGARLGTEAVIRLHPADSHIPEKSAQVLSAAWSAPAAPPWPEPRAPRPLVVFRPESVAAPEVPHLPARFRWRRRDLAVVSATGPERIAPEWWLDDPAWRSGARDYWHVVTDAGEALWLFYAHGAEVSGGWFCQGRFA